MAKQAMSHLSGWLLLGVALLVAIEANAQKPDRSIQEVLRQLRANMDSSVSKLPDVFCDEHLDSYESRDGKVRHEVTVDSVIEARRQSGDSEEFAEERHVNLLNGKPSEGRRRIDLQFSIAGGFGSVFRSYVASDFEQCNQYKLLPSPDAGSHLISLEVRRNGGARGVKPCAGLNFSAFATFWLDAETLDIQRFQMVIPNAHLPHGFDVVKSTTDYRLVPLGAKSYLLPAKVHATATKPGGSDELVYDADYKNCHRFGSSVRILTGTEPDAEKPQ
jgi:hypothetical protein